MDKPNLVQNPGFEEQGEGWSIPEGIMQIDRDMAHTGQHSLRFSWNEPGLRKLATRPVPIRSGKRYLIRAWLKSDNVHGAYKGATFGLEWGGKKGFIGGAYPMGVGWTTEWSEVVFLSGVTPRETTWGHVFATIDWGGIGTAWIDDISVTEVDTAEVLKWRMDPNRVVGAGESIPFAVQIEKIVPEVFGEEVDLWTSLCSPPWNAPLAEQKLLPQNGVRAEFATDRLAEGVYKFSAAVKSRKTGRTLMEPEIQTAWKRPPVECFLVPHSGVYPAGSSFPALSLRPYRTGTLSGGIARESGERVLAIAPRYLRAGRDVHIGWKGDRAPSGRYRVRLKLASAGQPDYETDVPFTVLEPGQAEKGVIIGPDNLLRDKDKVWFPMVVYAHTAYDPSRGESEDRSPAVTEDLLNHLTGTPFDLLDYATPIGGLEATAALADECARRGIRLILSVKDIYPEWAGFSARAKSFPGLTPEQMIRAVVRRLKDHPALALYYTNDELSTQYFRTMKALRGWIHEEDPLHPTLHVHYDLECIRELAPSYDIFGPELYPWPSDELGKMAEWSDRVTAALPEGAPFWGCLWAFREEPRAADKQRALAYLAIARGARGLLFYSYHDLRALKSFETRWKDLTALGREIESRLPVLLQRVAKASCRTRTRNIVLRTVRGPQGSWLLAVNAGKTAMDVRIDVPGSIVGAEEEGAKIELSNSRINLKMDPFQVRLIRLK